MTNPNYTKVHFLIDVSGSMDHIYKKLEKSMHLMLEQQSRKLAGYIDVDVDYFDNSLYEGERDADPMLLHLGMFASGGTNLYRSFNQSIPALENRIAAMPEDERPGRVVVIIVTDGASNMGGSETSEQLIAKLSRKDWVFAVAALYDQAYDHMRNAVPSIPKDHYVMKSANDKGIDALAVSIGEFITQVRGGAGGSF